MYGLKSKLALRLLRVKERVAGLSKMKPGEGTQRTDPRKNKHKRDDVFEKVCKSARSGTATACMRFLIPFFYTPVKSHY